MRVLLILVLVMMTGCCGMMKSVCGCKNSGIEKIEHDGKTFNCSKVTGVGAGPKGTKTIFVKCVEDVA